MRLVTKALINRSNSPYLFTSFLDFFIIFLFIPLIITVVIYIIMTVIIMIVTIMLEARELVIKVLFYDSSKNGVNG